ncbi:MAG: hypothetical protein ACRCSF_09520, partial [Mycobacteriaceae bacterium]
MEALYRGNWQFTDNISASVSAQASGLVAAHLQWHLERQLRTLPLIERHAPHAGVSTFDRSVRDGVGSIFYSVGQDGERDSATTRIAAGH